MSSQTNNSEAPQCPRMCHRSTPNARSISHSPSAPPPSFTQSPYPPRSLVRDDQTHPHRPRLVVSHSTCPPLSSSPHANSFVIGPAVIKHTHTQKQNTFVSKNLSDETNRVAFMKKRSAHTTGSTVRFCFCKNNKKMIIMRRRCARGRWAAGGDRSSERRGGVPCGCPSLAAMVVGVKTGE